MCWDKHANSSSVCFYIIIIIIANMVGCVLTVMYKMHMLREHAALVVLLRTSFKVLTGANLCEID